VRSFRAAASKSTAGINTFFFWGVRGALALPLALAVPDDLPHDEAIITIIFAVVGLSIFAQGLSIPLLLRR
jgi:monovalent cation:H+ antiporter, CPA1 family